MRTLTVRVADNLGSGYWTWGIILLILALSQIGGVIEKLWMQVWGEGRLLPSQDPSSDETSTGRK